MNKEDCRDRIWDAIDGELISHHLTKVNGLHEDDLEWLIKKALSSHKSITLKISKNMDKNHICIEIKNME